LPVPAPDPIISGGFRLLTPISSRFHARERSRGHTPGNRSTSTRGRVRRDHIIATEFLLSSVSFADLGVPTQLVASLDQRGVTAAFPIQAATIPDSLAGRDVSGRAPTGSGKTIAFGIPLVLGVDRASARRPRGLVLVPTRELASQVEEELKALGKPFDVSVLAIYGGVGFDRQIKTLRRGVDIIVACPGRLADLLSQGHLSLDEVEMVVVDEADRMADMGFLPEVRRLLDQCTDDRQTLLFSATLDGDVDVLIRKYQRDPVRHESVPDEADEVKADHYFWKVDRHDRVKTAAAVVDRLGPTIVFCRTKRGADRVAKQLGAAGVPAAAIHGDRSQGQRERALRSFHDGHVAALVATDVAARGIHVDNVAGVVHFDPPAEAKDYVHRSGRTARAGNTGVVVSLVVSDLRKPVASLQRQLGYDVGLDPVDVEALSAEPVLRRPAPRASGFHRPSSEGAPTVKSAADTSRNGQRRKPRQSRKPNSSNGRRPKRANGRQTSGGRRSEARRSR
jgi:superfamily II DNA/RNA helicase